MDQRRVYATFACALVALSSLLIAPPAAAAPTTAEPAVLNIGWWWKDAQTEEIDIQGNKVVIDTPSPFCPSTPGGLGAVPGACAEQRFPVEIRGGDYEEPHMLSGLGFDLSMLTPGSEVFEFKVSLLEAESGCRDGRDADEQCTPGAPNAEGDHVEVTDPIGPVDDRQVKACLLTQIFGDADGRPYTETPNYECPANAPTATRKQIEAVDEGDTDGIDHVWEFDLTPYAQEWAEAFSVSTSIMLVGEAPEQTGQDDTWRVVFAGPRLERGIVTKLRFEAAEISIPPIVPPVDPTDPSSFDDSGSFTGGTGTPSDFGSATDDSTGTPTSGSTPEPGATPGTDLASGDAPAIEGMPAYMWLAILAGLIGFFMVRQVVVESTSGIRPDGVLAKIHAMNAQRRGIDPTEMASEGGGVLAGAGAIVGALGHRLSDLKSKLPFGRK